MNFELLNEVPASQSVSQSVLPEASITFSPNLKRLSIKKDARKPVSSFIKYIQSHRSWGI